jgi:hypothetical protein
MRSVPGHRLLRTGRVRCAAVLAVLLALAGAGCQAGTRASATSGGGPVSTPSAPAPMPTPRARVPTPAGAGADAAFCGAGAGCPGGGVPAALRRPMRLPHLAAGTRCPVSGPACKVDPKESSHRPRPGLRGEPVAFPSCGHAVRPALAGAVRRQRLGRADPRMGRRAVLPRPGARPRPQADRLRRARLRRRQGAMGRDGRARRSGGRVGVNPAGWRPWPG